MKNKVLKDLEVKCPDSGLVNESKISILNLFPNNNGKLILKGKETNGTQIIEVDSKEILSISYEQANPSKIEPITYKNYFTENDLLLTYIDSYKKGNAILTGYISNYLNNLKSIVFLTFGGSWSIKQKTHLFLQSIGLSISGFSNSTPRFSK